MSSSVCDWKDIWISYFHKVHQTLIDCNLANTSESLPKASWKIPTRMILHPLFHNFWIAIDRSRREAVLRFEVVESDSCIINLTYCWETTVILPGKMVFMTTWCAFLITVSVSCIPFCTGMFGLPSIPPFVWVLVDHLTRICSLSSSKDRRVFRNLGKVWESCHY
jgi:hypothetical protein